MKIPSVDRTECTDCEICLEMAPTVFRRNDSGVIEVIDLPEYPEEDVDEVIKNCPCDCITWEEV